MKPIIESVFPFTKGTEIAGLHIENIKISKHLRKMHLVVLEDISEDVKMRAEDFFKKTLHLSDVFVCKKSEVTEEIQEQGEDTNIPPKAVAIRRPTVVRDLGKANVGEIIYGRTIRSDLMPISAINESSGVVTFSGTVFGFETKDIKSKKTGKEFHLIMI